jgi:nicotinamide-nucleotide amidase
MEALTSLAAEVIERARACGFRIVTAESCTGGALSTLFTDIPGAGEVLFGGFVSYAMEYKDRILGVPAQLIARHTAVSEPVAQAMARGALDLSRCDLSIAITGVTGPKPDEDGNPVGRVHITVALKDGNTRHLRCDFGEDSPGKICGSSLRTALQLALELLPEGGRP